MVERAETGALLCGVQVGGGWHSELLRARGWVQGTLPPAAQPAASRCRGWPVKDAVPWSSAVLGRAALLKDNCFFFLWRCWPSAAWPCTGMLLA